MRNSDKEGKNGGMPYLLGLLKVIFSGLQKKKSILQINY